MLSSTEIDFTPCLNQKNLLAFSAGIDSTALFFLLLEAKIPFDMAIVNYNTRPTSSDELAYAKTLAKEHNKKLFFLDTNLKDSAQESQARKIRYDFFESIIAKHHYEILLTAHQLNDQLEWFLMQLTKGAGSLELLGMQTVSKAKNYTLFKPLLTLSKEQLQAYLDHHHKHYFIDESNQDESFKRNYFRHNFSNALIQKYQEGIQRSFNYLAQDKELLLQNASYITLEQLTIIKAPTFRSRLYHIDKELKRRGYILSHLQRQEIEANSSIIISKRFAIEQKGDLAFIAPYMTATMDKSFKEACRTKHIPTKIRPYLFNSDIDLSDLGQQIAVL
jgi:tRNA(Ile)-lysidine synthase